MNIKRIYAVFIRQVYLVRDNFPRFVQMFVWTTVDIILWGFISKYVGGVAGSNLDFVPLFLGAVLLWDLLIQIMQGISMSFFEDMWSQNFLNIFASPMRISEYITGLVVTSLARGAIVLVGMLFLATFAFGFSVFIYGASLTLFLAILILFGIALGIFGISIVLRLGSSAEWFIWPIPALISPFVGVVYPISTLPQWMQYVGKFLPPSYVFTGVRSLVHGEGLSVTTLIGGIVLSFFYIMLAYSVFIMVYRRGIRSGRIARYSAEGVG